MRVYSLTIIFLLPFFLRAQVRDPFQYDPDFNCTEHTVIAYARVHHDDPKKPEREFTLKRAHDGTVAIVKKSPST